MIRRDKGAGLQAKVQQAAALLRSTRKNIALTGAGISTPSGIPDFRSPTSGIWNRYDPMEVASIFAFHNHPDRFYNWVRSLRVLGNDNVKPNAAHFALARMQAAGYLGAVITQNIDGLHQAAGVHDVIELHGNLQTATCQQCGHQVDAKPLWEAVEQNRPLPRCPYCGGILKPDVVLFGEPMPYEPLTRAQELALHCDTLLVVGSSLEVMPAADLPALAGRRGAYLIIVNFTPTAYDHLAEIVIYADVAKALPMLAKVLA